MGRAGPPRGRSWRSEAPPWSIGFAQSYLDIGAVLATRDGRTIGNVTVLAVEPHDRFGFVVKLVTDAGNDVTMREVRTAFHQPKWIRRIYSPAELVQTISKGVRYVVDLRRE